MLETELYRPFTVLGLILMLLGAILLLLPLILRYLPEIEKLPSIILYVYRKGNFIFVTSPILIIISLISIIYYLIKVLARSL
jgi:cell division protein FtsX